MDSLSTREKEMLKLHLEGYDFAEIAEITGDKSARKVEGVLYRMRKKLKGNNQQPEAEEVTRDE
nr:sigma factor-like helix-turn-helix DNA-binding protein [Gordonia sp. SID5947]